MNTDLDVFGSTAVAAHTRRDDGFTANITGSSMTAKRISIRGGKFRLMVNGKEIEKSNQDALDIVIVNASPHVHRMYFAKEFRQGEKMPPPSCWSSDSSKPDDTVSEKQADTCLACPQNIKGSGPSGTKACRFSRRIAVVRADDLNGDIYQMTLPAQSIFGNGTKDRKPLHEYTDYVRANGQNLMSVISRVSFDEDSSSTKIGFKPIRVLNDEEYAICSTKSTSDEAKRAITLSVSVNKEEDGEEFEQKKQQPIARPVDPVIPKVEDDIPEPTVRATEKPTPAPTPAPAPKPATPKIDQGDVSLDDLVSDWT
jgi:hypothetical protein